VSNEIGRILEAAAKAAPDVDDAQRRRIARAVLEAVDALIDEGDEDSTWPDRDDLGLLAGDIT
jgi:hypothetical protein